VSAKDIERSLSEWRAKLAAMSRNISDLGDLVDTPECVGIKLRMKSKPEAPGARPNLTNAQARAWLATRDELWACVKLVGDAIDRADHAVKDVWPWQLDAAVAEATKILESEAIELQTADVPVLRRSLLGGSHEVMRLTLSRMMDVMGEAFERGKQVLTALASAEEALAEKLARIEADVATLADGGWPDADRMRGIAAAARAIAGEDPVRAVADIDADAAPAIAAALSAMDADRQARAAAAADIAAARDELAGLGDAERHAAELAAAVRLQVTGLAVPPADRAAMLELPAWLGRLERTMLAGKAEAFRIGMQNWRAMLGSLRAALDAEERAYRAAADRRSELRDRFGALQAKRKVRSAAGVPDGPGTEEACVRLRQMLFGAATPLAEAELVFSDFESRVARMAAPKQTERP
jgi:hypothetical protein